MAQNDPMTASRIRNALREGFERASLAVPVPAFDALQTYVELLARWNRKVNLTAFDLERPSAAAIDRLVVEPAVASRLVRPSDRQLVDVGSGGGSPAVPLAILCPWLWVSMTEARERKAAFLREVVRVVELRADVKVGRFDTLVDEATADVVTCRAVRSEPRLWSAIARALHSGGHVLWFGRLIETGSHPGFACSSADVEPFAVTTCIRTS
jgi:16S rRNA (guanine527-N7)-methyltransferase